MCPEGVADRVNLGKSNLIFLEIQILVLNQIIYISVEIILIDINKTFEQYICSTTTV